MTTRRVFAATAESVGQSRRFVADALDGVRSEVRDAVALMVSELATNALIHADSDFELSIDQTPSFIRVEVRDASGTSPELRSPTSREPHGRGLRIVDELSDEWGTTNESDRPGKSIWFKVGLDDAGVGTGIDEHYGLASADPSPGAQPRPGSSHDPLAIRRPEPRLWLRERSGARRRGGWMLSTIRLGTGGALLA